MRQQLGWDQSDTLDSLLGYLLEEVAELKAEILQKPIDKQALESELADVLMVLLAMIDDNQLDPETIVAKKIKEVIKKYESFK